MNELQNVKNSIDTAKMAVNQVQLNYNELEAKMKKKLVINLIAAYADLNEAFPPTDNLYLTVSINVNELIGNDDVTRLQAAYTQAGKVVTITYQD